MDFVTRQFVVLTKKLRKEFRKFLATIHNDLTRLTDVFKNLKNTVNAQQHAEEKRPDIPPIAIAELRTQIPIRVQTETKRSKIETIWREIKGALETAGIFAAIIYAMVAYQQWQETITATNFSARQTELSRKGLNETIKNFRMGERAWIGIGNAVIVKEETTFPSVISYDIDVTNIGHSPAFEVSGEGYHVVEEGRHFRLPARNTTRNSAHSSGIMFPNITTSAPGKHYLTPDEIKAVQENSFFYIYGTFSYKDIFRHPHWLHYCYRLDPKLGWGPFHVCDAYNDTDDYPESRK